MTIRKELTVCPADNSGKRTTEESQSIEWYAEGQSRSVEVDGVRITVRLIDRKGRRSRILISAPVGAVFRQTDSDR